MYKTIQVLAQIGQTASIKQHQTVQQMLAEENMSEQEIIDLINSNTPLVCAWGIPEEEERENDDSDDNDDNDVSTQKNKKH